MSEHIFWQDDSGLYMREEIVRCRDCEFEMNRECSRIDEWHDELWFPVEPDGFCAWAERREHEQVHRDVRR